MPLQDSLGKKVTKPNAAPVLNRAKHLSRVPTMDDLQSSLVTALENMRQPVILTWKRDGTGPLLMLTVIRTADISEPTWTLNFNEQNNIVVLWSYSSSDPELIYNLITEKVREGGPAAVIPETLRPQGKGGSSQASGSGSPSGASASASPAASAEDSAQFFENYECLSTIGRGGMGIIYKARDRTDGSLVALKILKTDLLMDPVNVERFKHEASSVKSLAHPNLVRVLKFGVSRFGQPFLTMEFLEGVELKEILAKQKQLELPVFVNIFTQLCDALGYAHHKGLVHRDLKPGNIMLVKSSGGQDIVKVIDFGIAKSVSEQAAKSSVETTSHQITTSGHLVGSPAYMSPEQCAGATLDARSDIYSIGCVMYESISGVMPFRNDNIIKTILMHVNELPPFISVACPDLEIPGELDRIIMRCLQKNPEDRYQSARELCEDLWAFAATGYSSSNRLTAGSMRSRPKPAVHLQRTLQQNVLSDQAFTLLRLSGVVSDNVLKVVTNCETMVEKGQISIEQAVEVIRHAQSTSAANNHSIAESDKD